MEVKISSEEAIKILQSCKKQSRIMAKKALKKRIMRMQLILLKWQFHWN